MANEIASNLQHGEADDVVASRVADHLRRFWAPSMRQQLSAYEQRDGADLVPPCRLAVRRLAEEQG